MLSIINDVSGLTKVYFIAGGSQRVKERMTRAELDCPLHPEHEVWGWRPQKSQPTMDAHLRRKSCHHLLLHVVVPVGLQFLIALPTHGELAGSLFHVGLLVFDEL